MRETGFCSTVGWLASKPSPLVNRSCGVGERQYHKRLWYCSSPRSHVGEGWGENWDYFGYLRFSNSAIVLAAAGGPRRPVRQRAKKKLLILYCRFVRSDGLSGL